MCFFVACSLSLSVRICVSVPWHIKVLLYVHVISSSTLCSWTPGDWARRAPYFGFMKRLSRGFAYHLRPRPFWLFSPHQQVLVEMPEVHLCFLCSCVLCLPLRQDDPSCGVALGSEWSGEFLLSGALVKLLEGCGFGGPWPWLGGAAAARPWLRQVIGNAQ